MNNNFIRICLTLLLYLPGLVFSAGSKPADNTEFQIFKAQTEAKLDGLKEVKQQDLEYFKTQLETQNKTIDAFDKHIIDIDHDINFYSTLITVLALLVSLATYFSASTKAKNEAKKWFEDNENNLRERLKKLEDDAQLHVHNTKQEVTAGADALKNEISNIQRSMIASNEINITTDNPQLKTAADSLKQKPEAHYTFNDWNTRAYAAISENNFALAAAYFDKATQTQNANEGELAVALYNKGISYEQINQFKEAITIYEEVINKFSASSQQALQELVAGALSNIGNSYAHLNQSKEAISSWNDAIKRFDNSVFPGAQDAVGRAMSGIGFEQLLQAKKVWAHEDKRKQLITNALSILKKANAKPQRELYSKAICMGNIAYAQWLLGHNDEAKVSMREALQIGGQRLRDAELGDTKLHTVSLDEGFANLVNAIWDEIKPK